MRAFPNCPFELARGVTFGKQTAAAEHGLPVSGGEAAGESNGGVGNRKDWAGDGQQKDSTEHGQSDR